MVCLFYCRTTPILKTLVNLKTWHLLSSQLGKMYALSVELVCLLLIKMGKCINALDFF